MLTVSHVSHSAQPVLQLGLSRVLVVPLAPLHTSPGLDSRIKRVHRHKPMWQIKKLNKAIDEPITKDNKLFVQEVMNDRYTGKQCSGSECSDYILPNIFEYFDEKRIFFRSSKVGVGTVEPR